MEKKVTKKAPVKKKAAVALKDEAVVVDAKPVKKRAVKATKAVKKASKDIVLEPFAEVAEAVSPVKKRAAKRAAVMSKPGAIAIGSPKKKVAKKATLDATAEIAAVEPKVELSPVFKALADVTLPELKRENRARLQMQTPTRVYFYWSIKENPYHLLKRTFGDDTGSYTLVLKLTNLRNDTEEIHACESEGNWWFSVEPDGEYQAEVGFYAPNRPYFRIVYSNTIETPRRSPSPHPASEARWTVSANKFAEVLDVAGFSRDAFDVAMAGDNIYAATDATQTAFNTFVGATHDLNGVSAEDIRYAMIAIAAGATLEELRFRVSPALFAVLQANAEKLNAGKAMSALSEHFDIDEAEFVEEELGSAVFGASLVNFPRTLKTRTASAKYSPRYNPVSSHSIR
ncbi:MAG TPA: DUF4912 domain-containing protein [Pyrinomonadaceae bacterium]|nr:DUF4912 domain-containing protein [Pyrinomonadaceae bacterium]